MTSERREEKGEEMEGESCELDSLEFSMKLSHAVASQIYNLLMS